MTVVNPVLNPTLLLRPQEKGVYLRKDIYDVTWNNPAYSQSPSPKIVPQVGSLVQDVDGTALWVSAIADVTLIPTYTSVQQNSENSDVVSLLNYGNTQLRLYGDYRKAPYPVTVDPKCIFIGKSPRFYTLSRYPDTANETVISQYYDPTGQLVSQMVPLAAVTSDNTSWYLPRCRVIQTIPDNEEILVRIYNEDGVQVYSAILHAKTSAVINEDVLYSPTITSMTVTANQVLADGSFYVYENQDFSSLGITANLVYSDGTTKQVPIDGVKCVMYGHQDFIASAAGLRQYVTIKYFRSETEAISSSISDATGQMISVRTAVTVVPNTLGVTVKIMAMPVYSTAMSKYVVKHYMYYGDGRSFTDVSAYVTITGNCNGTSAYFGVVQSYVASVDMHQIDPTNYPVPTTYQQSVVITFFAPTQVVRWTVRDSLTSQYVYGLDNASSRRPSIRYDSTLKQYFIPAFIFGNKAAFLNSFYYMASPPYDPNVSATPQVPTHFVIRELSTGNMLVSAPISVDAYSTPFSILNDTTGQYNNAVVVVEFINLINLTTRRVLYGVPVNVSTGVYVSN